jgi:hypothetical protein
MIANLLNYMYMIRKNPCHDTETPAGQVKTGWPEGMLQDDSRELSRALSNTPGAKLFVRRNAETLGEYIKTALDHEKKLEDEGVMPGCRDDHTQQR